MGEIVNLNQVRKQRARAEARKLAQENRVRHGRTGAQKQSDRRTTDDAEKHVQDHRLIDRVPGPDEASE
ncbi:DUF4169 family protein [Lichenicoccus roseus]|uniref:DUF4169 family protein n=1 Tax=Lichenicoccus roseus TaxID=2683649 RepID=A0A5R9JA00_9PROT|nr:DUF4169 family protein [Lichenicoccus roseus]TLU73829.1 DUF4169 family protein [Lichenicoccus roseus]